MSKTVNITIHIDGLPNDPDKAKKLVEAIEQQMDQVVGIAMADTYEDGMDGKDWSVHVS